MKIIQTDALLLALFVVITYSSDALTVRDDDDASSMDHHSLGAEKKEKPLAQICCKPGFYYQHSQCRRISDDSSVTYQLEFPVIYNSKGQLSNLTSTDFQWAYGVPCSNGMESLEPEEYYFQENGTILLMNSPILTPKNYCLAVIQGNMVGAMRTVVASCFPEPSLEDLENDFDKDPKNLKNKPTLVKFLEIIFCLISGILLTLTFVIYMVVKELRNIHGMVVMVYVLMLSIAYCALSFTYIGQEITFQYLNICLSSAYIVHFSFLASFFWLNVMCFDIWWTFGGFRSLHGSVKQRERKKFIMYSIYAWGSASVLTLTCMVMDLVPGIPESFIRPEFGKESCWFYTQEARLLYFYAPMGVTVVCNIFLFILTSLKILKHKKDTARQLKGSDSRRHDDNKQWFNLYLKLFIVMGINWSTEIISWVLQDKWDGKWNWLWYITDLANTLQGVIIFIIFVWKDKIKRLLLRRFGREGGSFLSRNSTRNGCATTHSTATSCVTTTAPLQEKTNPYSWKDPKGKTNVTFDESDEV